MSPLCSLSSITSSLNSVDYRILELVQLLKSDDPDQLIDLLVKWYVDK